MTCANCKQHTEIGKAFMLPFLYRDGSTVKQLAACSKECEQQWLADKKEVEQIQSDYRTQNNKA